MKGAVVVEQNKNPFARRAQMPTDVSKQLSIFDHLATRVSGWVSKAWFFAFCVLLVVVWAPSIWLLGGINTWQLIINTITTIITFLLVALLQNTQSRATHSTQHKLNAIADAVWDLMGELGEQYPELRCHRDELAAAVGLEQREGSAG